MPRLSLFVAIALAVAATAHAQEMAVDVNMPAFCAASQQPPELSSTYPSNALRRGRGGTVVVDCAMDAEGRTSTCRIVSERPANRDFGRAGLEVACRFVIARDVDDHLDFTDVDGHYFDQQTQSHRVRTTINFSARGSALRP